MKIVSMNRKIDEMGRLVVPKEVQELLDIDDDSVWLKLDRKHHRIRLSAQKQKADIQQKLDMSGRLQLPDDFRKTLKWNSNTVIGLAAEGQIAYLQENASSCVICGMNASLLRVKGTLVCEDCINTGNDAVVDKWSQALGQLFEKYKGYCDDAVSFKDTEDVHKARTKGRRLRTLIHFIGVEKDHKLYKRLKKAHDELGDVREDDVFIEAFEEEAENNGYGDVYPEFSKKVQDKRKKHRKSLKDELPDIIDDEFVSLWNEFEREELRGLILSLDIKAELRKHENDFNQRLKTYHDVISDNGKESEEGLDALHEVRKKAKKLRYIYSYLDKMYSGDFMTRSSYFKNLQDKLGEIIDLRDWIEQTVKVKGDVDAKKNDIKSVRKQLKSKMDKLVSKVDL